MDSLESERLILRQWGENDKASFYPINSDPEVMKFYPEPLSKEKNDRFVDKARSLIEKNGWGFWACELKSTAELIGFVGLNQPDYDLPFSAIEDPCTEIGWRLAKKHWHNGYATEAAKACLKYGFEHLKLPEIVAFAVKDNQPSISVMQRIGMSNTCSNFVHPLVADVDHLKEHVLYKITAQDYVAAG